MAAMIGLLSLLVSLVFLAIPTFVIIDWLYLNK